MARYRSASRRECRFLDCRVKNVVSPLPLTSQHRGQRSKPVLVDGRSRPLTARRRETYPRARARVGQRQRVDETPSTVSYVRAHRLVVSDPQPRSRSSASAEAPALVSLAVVSISGTSGQRQDVYRARHRRTFYQHRLSGYSVRRRSANDHRQSAVSRRRPSDARVSTYKSYYARILNLTDTDVRYVSSTGHAPFVRLKRRAKDFNAGGCRRTREGTIPVRGSVINYIRLYIIVLFCMYTKYAARNFTLDARLYNARAL